MVWNNFYFSIYCEQSSQLTNILQRGRSTTNQLCIVNSRCNFSVTFSTPTCRSQATGFLFGGFDTNRLKERLYQAEIGGVLENWFVCFPMFLWLVVWNMFLWLSIYWECHNTNWRTPSFSRGIETTHQPAYIYIFFNSDDILYDLVISPIIYIGYFRMMIFSNSSDLSIDFFSAG